MHKDQATALYTMKRSFWVLFGILGFTFGYSFLVESTAGNSSASPEDRPQRNYFGSVKSFDAQEEMRVEYIAMTTRMTTDHIYVYGKPADTASNPQDHKSEIDFAAITRIEVPPQQTPQKFAKIDYIEITIEFKGAPSVKRTYLVEATRRLFCDELDGDSLIPQEFRISAVQYVIIEGVQSADVRNRKPQHIRPPATAERKQHFCAEASKAINSLEIEAGKLPSERKNDFRGLIDKVKNWVGGICNG